MIFYFLAGREVVYRQVRLEFQMTMENRDGKASVSEFFARCAQPVCPGTPLRSALTLSCLLVMNLLIFPLHTSQNNSLNISLFWALCYSVCC